MQTCFHQQLIPIHSLASLANYLQMKRQEGGQWLDTPYLEELYSRCDIPADHWNLITSLLEKLAVMTNIRQ